MLITNLGSLKAELARYMFHQRFQPDYDTAIANFEAVANRRLRVRPMETAISLTYSANAESISLPTDYLLWRAVLWQGRQPFVELDYVHPAYLRSTLSGTTAGGGKPQFFTIRGEQFQIAPVINTDQIYQFHYYQKIPTINGDDNNSNWLLAAHPDLYLNGSLFELFALGRNGEAAVAHKQLRDEKFGELIQLSALTTGATSSKVRGETAEYF